MEFQNNKCSSEVHKDIEASKFCQECNLYFCDKCEKQHSELIKSHHIFPKIYRKHTTMKGICH